MDLFELIDPALTLINANGLIVKELATDFMVMFDTMPSVCNNKQLLEHHLAGMADKYGLNYILPENEGEAIIPQENIQVKTAEEVI